MSNFSQDEKFKYLLAEPKQIEPLLTDHMTLVSGDFYGIQKFIFEGLSTKNASKVLRAKSAFVQLFTDYIARYICSELGISDNNVLSAQAGRFEILVPTHKQDLSPIQKKIDEYFIRHYYGLSGIKLSSVDCTKEDFTDPNKYRQLRRRIIDSVEAAKFHKFDLNQPNAPSLLKYDTGIDNQTLCKVCNIRKIIKGNECDICHNFIELGKRLSKKHIDEIVSSEDVGIEIDGFAIDLKLTSAIRSYVFRDEDEEVPANFEMLAKYARKLKDDQGNAIGIEAIAVLKADVDNMGKFLSKEDNPITESFEAFDRFSISMDNFFSLYIPQLMKEKFPHTYTVFAGGDDLFLVGAWDEIVELAREIEEEFKTFVGKTTDLSISFGIAITKPKTPISYLATHTEELLEHSKDMEGKDAITLFGETVKWGEYRRVYEEIYHLLENYDSQLNTAFLYRLLDLIEMSKRYQQEGHIPSTMWKSKFRYTVHRNIGDDKMTDLIEALSDNIDKYPQHTKMVLDGFIYKRRK